MTKLTVNAVKPAGEPKTTPTLPYPEGGEPVCFSSRRPQSPLGLRGVRGNLPPAWDPDVAHMG